MAAHRNVTLSLPVQVLRRLKRIAARRQTSLSQLATQALAELAAREAGYAQAQARGLSLGLPHASDLGTQGRSPAARETLHAR